MSVPAATKRRDTTESFMSGGLARGRRFRLRDKLGFYRHFSSFLVISRA
jgi:hypothetical protein